MTDLESDATILEPADPLLGALIAGRYQIRDRIAAGGFGAIYRAFDLATIEPVAIKILHHHLSADPAVVARFRREGIALASLRDPHTVRVLDLGEVDGMLYLVMELLRGESLYELSVASGPLPWQRVVAIARGVCEALIEAHAIGIVHRDLKPANIHLEQGDAVLVLDFGIAKILHGGHLHDEDLTHIGQMIGTFEYMPPEQMIGGSCDARSDLFTLGVGIYEAIAGVRPYGNASTPAAQMSLLLSTTPEPMTRYVAVPDELGRIVARCVAREPEERYQNARELARDLAHLCATEPASPARRRSASPRMLPAMTLPGVVPPMRRTSQPWPRLASGTSPVENEPIAMPPVEQPPLARWRVIAWVMVVVAFSVLVALLISQS